MRLESFTLPDQADWPWELDSALSKGAVVLVFIRGDW